MTGYWTCDDKIIIFRLDGDTDEGRQGIVDPVHAHYTCSKVTVEKIVDYFTSNTHVHYKDYTVGQTIDNQLYVKSGADYLLPVIRYGLQNTHHRNIHNEPINGHFSSYYTNGSVKCINEYYHGIFISEKKYNNDGCVISDDKAWHC